jgi:hypothetical protein
LTSTSSREVTDMSFRSKKTLIFSLPFPELQPGYYCRTAIKEYQKTGEGLKVRLVDHRISREKRVAFSYEARDTETLFSPSVL